MIKLNNKTRPTIKYLAFIIILLIASNLSAQTFSIGVKAGVGDYTFKTSDGKSYLKNFPNFEFNNLTYGILASVKLDKLTFSYSIRNFSQSMTGDEVVLPPFVYSDNWADVQIEYSRLQNFIGIGYEIPLNKVSIIPQFDFMFSFSNKFDVNLAFNDEAVNTPAGEVADPNFSVGTNEFGGKFSLGLNYMIIENLALRLTPSYFYGEMELGAQNNSLFSGGDNKTLGAELDLSIIYLLN